MAQVIDIPKLFIESNALSAWPRAIHVNYNPEMFIVSVALSSKPRDIHVLHNRKLVTQSSTRYL